MTIDELLTQWEQRSRSASPADAMLINKHIRELREALLPFDSDLVRDAERYRWLRDHRRAAIPEFESGWDVVAYINGGEEESIISAQTLDAAVDAAIHAQAGGSES